MAIKKEIAFVSKHCCIRVLKEAECLSKLGWKIHLISEIPNTSRSFITNSVFNGVYQLEQSIKLIADNVSLFHVHNEPSYFATVIRENCLTKPIVFDMHDSNYWRMDQRFLDIGVTWYEEDTAIDCSDAFVFPSNACMETKNDMLNGRSAVVIPSATPVSYFKYEPTDYRGGLVSQGGHSLPSQHAGEGWRDYTNLYKSLIDNGIMVCAYSAIFDNDASSPVSKHYIDLGCKLGTFSYGELLNEVKKHDWNLVGNLVDHPVWKVALPNKFFDAIASGTPSVNFNCPEVAELIDEYKIGINVKSIEEFLERYDEFRIARKNLYLKRKALTLERFIPNLIKLYESLV